jgi:hypothetical protein
MTSPFRNQDIMTCCTCQCFISHMNREFMRANLHVLLTPDPCTPSHVLTHLFTLIWAGRYSLTNGFLSRGFWCLTTSLKCKGPRDALQLMVDYIVQEGLSSGGIICLVDTVLPAPPLITVRISVIFVSRSEWNICTQANWLL